MGRRKVIKVSKEECFMNIMRVIDKYGDKLNMDRFELMAEVAVFLNKEIAAHLRKKAIAEELDIDIKDVFDFDIDMPEKLSL